MEHGKSPVQRRNGLFLALSSILIMVLMVLFPAPTASITVFAPSEPPVADAGQEITGVLKNDVVTLNGSASTDDDIDNCTWVWECITDPQITITPDNSSMPSFTAPGEGTFTFRLNLTDPQGQYDTADVDVIVDANQPPSLSIISPIPTGPEGPFYPISTPIIFSANGTSDPEGRDLSYRWTSNVSGRISTEKYYVGALEELGWHSIALNVSDPNGEWSEESVEIMVREDYIAPEASIRILPSRPTMEYLKQESITLDGSGTTDGNTEESLNFTWTSNITDPSILGYGETLSLMLTEGSHNITLTVEDSDGLTDSEWAHIKVMNTPPRAVITASDVKLRDGDPTVNEEEQVEFSAFTSSDPDGDGLVYRWEFGDGNIGEGMNVSHSWSLFGSYNVTLTVNDGSLEKATDSVNFTIQVNSIPEAMIDVGIVSEVDERFTISGNGSNDDDGDPLNYFWDFNGDGQPDASGFSTTWEYPEEGVYDVTLNVSDGFAWTFASTTVKVQFPNERPVAAISNQLVDGEVVVPLRDDRGEVDLDASASYDPDDDVNGNQMIDGDEEDNLTYTWDIDPEDDSDGDEIPDNDIDLEGQEVSVDLEDSGLMKVILNVTDPRGVSDRLEIKLRGNNPPEMLTIRVGPAKKVLVGAKVTFTGGANDDDRGDENQFVYTWDFGDGVTISRPNFQATHTYLEDGDYEVIMKVSDGLSEEETRTSVNVVELEAPSLTYPSNNSEISGIVEFKGKIREVLFFDVDKVEIKVGDRDWKEADGTTEWTYSLNTAILPNGDIKVLVRYTVEDAEPITSTTEMTLIVSNQSSTDNTFLYIIIGIVVFAILFFLIYLIFIRKKPRNFEEYLPPPPPSIRNPPGVPPGGLPPRPGGIQNLPGGQKPPEKEAPKQAAPPEPEKPEGPKFIRIKCPSCTKIFKMQDSGERPLHISCKHCGAKGMIETIPGDQEEKEEEKPKEEEEEVPEPLPIVCPSCSGLFELTEIADTAKCPHCDVEGELDEDTISLLKERFGEDEEKEDLTLRCPTCSGTFKVKEDSDAIICPYCGAKGKASS